MHLVTAIRRAWARRPGALDRGELRSQRGKEKFMGFIGMKGIAVATVGRAMRVDAETKGDSPGETLSDGQIKALASL